MTDAQPRCSSINPASGLQCTRPANGHSDHEADMGDVKQMWEHLGMATYTPGPPHPMTALAEVVAKDAKP